MFKYRQHAENYFSRHVVLGHFAHALGGFAIAVLLQQYLQGNAFMPAWGAWIMIIIAVGIHVKAYLS